MGRRGRTALRYGQRLIPAARHTFLMKVMQTPNSFATSASGMWNLFRNSSSGISGGARFVIFDNVVR
jgi:hypothetical protein